MQENGTITSKKVSSQIVALNAGSPVKLSGRCELRLNNNNNNNNNNNSNNAVLGHYTMSQCPYKFTDIEK